MKTSERRVLAGTPIAFVVIATVLVGSLAGIPSAIAKTRASEVSVTGSGAATLHDEITLLAGSATRAVYSVRRAEVQELGSGYGDGKSRPVLTVRDKSGKVIRLGAMSNRVQGDGFSTFGNWVVAWSSVEYQPHTPKVDVWNIATRRHRVVTLSKAAKVVQATPKGFVYTFGSSLKEWVASTNSYRSWGTPFPKQNVAWFSANKTEMLITGAKSGAVLMPLSKPGKYRTLKTGKGSYTCYAVNATGAACEINRAAGAGAVGYLPLDGGKAVRTSHTGVMLDDIALSGREVIYTGEVTDDVPYVYGFSADDPTPVKWDTLVKYNMISAYGKALVMRAGDPDEVLAVTTPNDINPAFAIARSADTSGEFALTSGRVAFVSDLNNAADPTQTLGVQSATITDGQGGLKVGTPSLIAGRDGQLQVEANLGDRDDVAATDTATAFMRASDCCTWHAYVKTPSGTTELPGTFDPNGDYLEAAGHRVLAANPLGANGPIELYDTSTGQVQDLSAFSADQPDSFALTASDLFYGTRTGAVRQLDLNTGLTTTIYTAFPGKPLASKNTDVFATDDWVAWDVSMSSGGKLVRSEGMRKVGTVLGSVVSLPHPVFGISGSGVLLRGTDGLYAQRTWIRPFSGAMRTLLSSRQYGQLPQLVGQVLAWVDGGGDLMVERYAS